MWSFGQKQEKVKKMSEFEEIERLEKLLERYQNNYAFAVKNNNSHSQTKYKNLVRKTELQIENLEKKILNSNDRLAEKITELHSTFNILTEKEKLAKLKTEELKKQISRLFLPIPEPILEVEDEPELEQELTSIPEIIPETEAIPELEEGKLICFDCGKVVNGERGLRTHQSQWCIKKEAKIS